MKKCDKCQGQGGIDWQDGDHTHWEYCDACGGTGEVEDGKVCCGSCSKAGCCDKQSSVYERAVNLWGTPSQLALAVEECSELIKEISKWGRTNNGSDEYKVADEIADVEIMMEQLRYIVGREKVDAAKKRKLERLRRLVGYGEGTA